MNLDTRISTFSELGKQIKNLPEEEFVAVAEKASQQNPWFTKENIKLSLTGIRNLLLHEKLAQWISAYNFSESQTCKTVALVLAGNIPLVGFHDLLSVLISGHKAMIKMSSKDSVLLPFITDILTAIEPAFEERIAFVQQIKSFDAVIATGSDNSARYFERYFGKYPHIIRKNRTSCAILSGQESEKEIKELGRDVFSYFGLGCRNVSKLFVPKNYNFNKLFDSWQLFKDIVHHHKYNNNYDYQKAILLVTKQPFLDTGFVLAVENEKTVSPIATIYYQYYTTTQQVTDKLLSEREKIQCTVGNAEPSSVPFGQAQCPDPWDYADNVDTLRFLTTLPES